jgi:hypothetical protein
MIDAIVCNPGITQAAAHRAAAPTGADFQSWLSAHDDPTPGSSVVGRPGSGRLLHLPPLHHSDEDTAALQQALSRAFQAAGVDTSQPIELGIGADGYVVAKGDNPQKAAIEKVFKDHPALRNLYAKVAQEDELSALGRVTSFYAHDYANAVGDAAQQAVWGKYEPIFQKIGQLGSELTFSGGTLTSAALTYAEGLYPQPYGAA